MSTIPPSVLRYQSFPAFTFPLFKIPRKRACSFFMAMLKYKKHFVDYLFTLRNTIASV